MSGPVDLPPPSAYVYLANGFLPNPFAQKAPSDSQLHIWAAELRTIFADGFQWSDLGIIIKMIENYLSSYHLMSIFDKRATAIQLLDRLINLTDTPYLPSDFTDSLFKKMIPPFVNLVITDQELLPPFLIDEKPSQELLETNVSYVLRSFKTGFFWDDLALVTQFVVQFADQFEPLSSEERANIAIAMMDSVIEQTDTLYLPDSYSDSIFKAFVRPIIDLLLGVTRSY